MVGQTHRVDIGGLQLKRAIVWTLLAALLAPAGCYSSFDDPGASPRTGAPTPGTERQGTERQPPAAAPSRKPTAGQPKKKKKPEQTYQQAWRIICHAEQLSRVDPTASAQQKGAHVARWIVEHLKNKKARYWFISLGQVEKPKKLAVFRAEAQRAGFASCAVQDLLFSEPSPAGEKSRGDGGSR